MWICEDCSRELSAMLGDNEVPERCCECGGKIEEKNNENQ
jgi:DNA-directed RNA polymerase subunit RPC12/RpoP